ncbi:hypothetical protein Hanom_Chr02g00147381 [Helianthus anomalus]
MAEIVVFYDFVHFVGKMDFIAEPHPIYIYMCVCVCMYVCIGMCVMEGDIENGCRLTRKTGTGQGGRCSGAAFRGGVVPRRSLAVPIRTGLS